MKKSYLLLLSLCYFTPVLNASIINCIDNQVVSDNSIGCTYIHSGTDWDPLIPDTCSLNMLKSTFDTDAEGWAKHSPSDPNTNLTWYSTDGNPGGYIRLNDAAQGIADWFAAPAKFLGDKSLYYGGVLKFDIRHSHILSGSQVGVRLIGNGITIQATIARPNQTWKTYVIPLSVGNWTVLSGSLATQEEIMQVLVNISTFNISGDWRSGTEQTSIDNVMMLGGTVYYELSGATSGSGTTLNDVVLYPGITTVTWTITDACLNISYCTFTVTIPGNEFCQESETVIYVSNTIVDSCDKLVLIAGQSIHILPGFHANYGSRFLAKIDSEGGICNDYRTLAYAKDQTSDDSIWSASRSSEFFFQIFPNPTTGRFSLELNGLKDQQIADVEIFNMLGKKLISEVLPVAGQFSFDLSGQQKGLYLMRVAVGSESGIEKIIKQ